ncbi:MAG: hypothetical protein V4739_13090 [Pseudomonadota bacterium]
MDCAIPAAAELAAQAMGSQAGSSGTSLCEQGRRFAELLQAPAEQGAPGGAAVQPVTDTYVPAPAAPPSGGVNLMDAIDKVRSITLPRAEADTIKPSSESFDGDPSAPTDPTSDLSDVMRQSVVWQTEVIRISMMGDMVSSMNQGVRTLFQQQG